jgi:hypothetical protein
MEKYKLTKKEIKNLDNYWKFIDIFSKPDIEGLSNNWWSYQITKNNKNNNKKTYYPIFGPYNYRQYIIPKIRKLYTPEQFYFYEKILNKLLWNLLDKIKFDIKKFYEYLIRNKKKEKMKFDIRKCNKKKEKQSNKIKNKYLYNHSRSFCHKTFISNYIFFNYMDLVNFKFHENISMIMRNRKLYEYIIHKKKFDIKKKFNKKMYNLIDNKTQYTYYYPCDYPFPNVNFISYNETKKKVWIDRIKNLYYKKKKITILSMYKNYKHKIYDDSGWYGSS